jgi:hypothetical protein
MIGTDDRELMTEFEDRTLPPESFDHRCHLRMAWLYLRWYGFPHGATRFMEALRAYVNHLGVPQKYHETITWAYFVLLNEELTLRAQPGETFDELLLRRPDFLARGNGSLLRYYTPERLQSDEARRVFLLPQQPSAD